MNSKGKKSLVALVGATAATLLAVSIPREESGRTVSANVSADQSLTVTHVAGKQYLKPYLDIVGVATACDGITKGVKLGQTYTAARCNELLEQEIVAHAEPVLKCIPALKGRPYQTAAAIGLAFNVGPAGVCTSSIASHWNAGRWTAGCERFPAFNKASGRVVRGLVLRRERERQTCLTGLRSDYTAANLDVRVRAVR